jgi:methyl-accepting chemotaxis protein
MIMIGLQFFNDRSIKAKLAIAFGSILIVTISISAFTYHTVVSSEKTTSLVEEVEETIDLANFGIGAVSDIENGFRGFMLTGLDASLEPHKAGKKTAEENVATLSKMTADHPDQTARWKEFQETLATWDRDVIQKGFQLRREVTAGRVKIDEISAFEKRNSSLPYVEKLKAILVAGEARQQEIKSEILATIESSFALLLKTVVAGATVVLLLGLFAGYILNLAIARPILKTVTILEAVAKGDLSHRVDVMSLDEVGRMGRALNIAIENTSTSIKKSDDLMMQIQVQFEREKTVEAERAEAARVAREAEYRAHELEKQREREAADRRESERRSREEGTQVELAKAQEVAYKVELILQTMSQVAMGDFTQSVPDLGDDAIGKVGSALNQLILSMRQTLSQVREVTERLADASIQMSSASEEISSGAQQQASSLEETASTLEEITSTVKQNSDAAQQAQALASGSREVAEKGGSVVGTAVEAMEAINTSSKKIADIITTIDEIAFQTNLLALNAAVEAARAGEQGRGFAVVATEVRNLAQRSAGAAKEIKTLIHDSVQKVGAGTDLVNRSGTTLGEIVTSVKRVTDIISEIAAASREQATGIEQVNKAMMQMDTVTQNNASQTEEMSATAQMLTSNTSELRELVSQFKLGNENTFAPMKTSKSYSKPNRSIAASKPLKNSNRPKVALSNGVHAKPMKPAMHELDQLSSFETTNFEEF